jgi:HPt (histidine-containing phosphotransfer) domain-containing protein
MAAMTSQKAQGGHAMTEIFDRQALLQRVDGDEELLEEMVVIFLEFTPRQLQEIRQALKTGDAEFLRGRAHSIRGAAASISAGAVQQAAGELENAGKKHDLAQAALCFKALDQEFSRFQEVMTG